MRRSSSAAACCYHCCCARRPEAARVGARVLSETVRTRLWVTGAVFAAALATAVPAAADPDVPTPPPAPMPEASHEAGSSPGPGVMDRDGTFAVGTEILPGVYTSPGPLPGDTCYWRRIGADGTTLENALSKKPQTVRIDVADVAFKTNGCQAWTPTDAPPPGQNPPWMSQLQLRHNLDILNGLAGQSGNGQLPAY